MRAVSISPDALVVTSGFWQTNAVALRAGDEAMLIDSPYLPDELDALPALLAGAGFEPDGLLATHADFDHLLGRLAFPGHDAGARRELAWSACSASPGGAQRGAAQVRRRVLRDPPGAARARTGPGAAGAGPRRARRPRAGAAPGRGPHRRRDGDLRPRSRASCAWATTSRTSRSRGSRGGSLARLPGDAGAAGARWSRHAHDCRARPRRAARPRDGAAPARRGRRLPGRARARRASSCRRAATPRPSAASTRRTSPGFDRAVPGRLRERGAAQEAHRRRSRPGWCSPGPARRRPPPSCRRPTASTTAATSAAGERAYVVGSEAGRFPATGWHIRGEMGGVWSPPIKLLDGIWFALDGEWIGPATRFTSGWGYVGHGPARSGRARGRRVEFAPDGRRAAADRPAAARPPARRAHVSVDGGRPLGAA